MTSIRWKSQDLKRMKTLGIEPSEANRQLELFKNPPPFASLDRPALTGDGIIRLNSSQEKSALRKFETARRKGRFIKFVPASGAASRMFHLLMKFLQRKPFSPEDLKREIINGEKDSRQFLEFMESISKFAFFDELGKVMAQRGLDLETLRREGRFGEILEALLLPNGLNYSQKPKGLIRFHTYSGGARTPLEEHLVEAVETVRDGGARCRIHFTVSEEHQKQCRGHFLEVREKHQKKFGVRFNARFSIQRSSTNTLAVDGDNRPFRDREGRLVFRPSGHGSLLENLNDLKGDLVFIKNIDNVTMEHSADSIVNWKKILGGYLVTLQEETFKFLRLLSIKKIKPGDLLKITTFTRKNLMIDLGDDFSSLSPAQKGRRLKEALDRPIRVCGVVVNTGEPGGGPFWVRGLDGRNTLQIVESAQIDLKQKKQKKIFEKSTHFNPVDLVCGVRHWNGKPFDLNRFRDSRAVFISRKSMEGKELKALELPGLWNGAMADWITLFVEVPLDTFNPVKTFFDLLKPAHQVKV